jgi:hypothetical protein
MQKYFFRFTFFLFIFSVLFLAGEEKALAIGISPSTVRAVNVANNIDIPKTFTVSRGNPSKEEKYTVKAIGNGAAYIKLPSDPFVLPKGIGSVPYNFSIHPIGAQNGNYESTLIFSSIVDPVDAQSGSFSLSIGLRGQVLFDVTDKEVKNFSIIRASGDNSELGQPVSFSYTLKNDGNVDARPDKIAYSFVDNADSNHTYQGEISGANLSFVPAGQTVDSFFQVQDKIVPGRYVVKLAFYLGDVIIGTSQNINIAIFEAGTLKQQALVKDITISKSLFQPGEIVTFTGVIQNKGDLQIQPILQIQIEKDGKQIEKLSSPPKSILKGQGASYDLTYRPTEPGKFLAKAYFEYGIVKTDLKELSFEVKKPASYLYIAVGFGILLLLFIIYRLAKKFLSKDDIDEDPSESQELK